MFALSFKVLCELFSILILITKSELGIAKSIEVTALFRSSETNKHEILLEAFPDVLIKFAYLNFGQFNIAGYTAIVHDDAIKFLRKQTGIFLLESVRTFSVASCSISTSQSIESELFRMTQRKPCTYEYEFYEKMLRNEISNKTYGSGHGIDVYVVDTGIDSSHKELNGRVRHGFSVFDDTDDFDSENSHSKKSGLAQAWENRKISSQHTLELEIDDFFSYGIDPHGHGTHIAAIIGGRTIGLARNSSLIDVRVFDEKGKTTSGAIIAGLDFIAGEIQSMVKKGKNPGIKKVINLSFSGQKSGAVNAILSAMSISSLIVASSGDQAMNSCEFSPGGAGGVISVAATSRKSQLPAPHSNFGDCVHVFAPGEDIRSASLTGSVEAYERKSGSSVSTAIVSGLAATYLEYLTAKNDVFSSHILSSSVMRMLLGLPKDATYSKDPHRAPYEVCESTNIENMGYLLLDLAVKEIKRIEEDFKSQTQRFYSALEEEQKLKWLETKSTIAVRFRNFGLVSSFIEAMKKLLSKVSFELLKLRPT